MLWRVSADRRRLKPAGFIPPCLASVAQTVPIGPGWLYEIKHDGYRMQMCKRGDRVLALVDGALERLLRLSRTPRQNQPPHE